MHAGCGGCVNLDMAGGDGPVPFECNQIVALGHCADVRCARHVVAVSKLGAFDAADEAAGGGALGSLGTTLGR